MPHILFHTCNTVKVTNSHKQFTPRAETSQWETVTKGLVLGLFDYTQTGLCKSQTLSLVSHFWDYMCSTTHRQAPKASENTHA